MKKAANLQRRPDKYKSYCSQLFLARPWKLKDKNNLLPTFFSDHSVLYLSQTAKILEGRTRGNLQLSFARSPPSPAARHTTQGGGGTTTTNALLYLDWSSTQPRGRRVRPGADPQSTQLDLGLLNADPAQWVWAELAAHLTPHGPTTLMPVKHNNRESFMTVCPTMSGILGENVSVHPTSRVEAVKFSGILNRRTCV